MRTREVLGKTSADARFAEEMTDRQAADALRARVGWKFCLSLELADPGCGASMLSEFRARLAQGGRGELLPHPGLADAGYVSVDHILAARAP